MSDNVNWGALMRPQPEAKAIGTAAVSSNNMSMGNPAGEISSSLNQGLERQQMRQNIQLNDIKLQQANQDWTDEQTLRNANMKDEKTYMGVLQQTSGPLAVEAYKQTKLKTQEAIQTIAKNDQDLEKGSFDAMTAGSLTLGTAANAAHQQQVFATQQTLKNAGVQQDPKTGQSFMVDPKTKQPVPVPPQLIQKAQQQGQAAGQAMWNFKQQQMTPMQRQTLKDAGLTQWNDNVNHAMTNQATSAIADFQAKKNAESPDKIGKLEQDTEYKAKLQEDVANNVPGAAQKLQIANQETQKRDKQVSLLLSPSGQQAFTKNTDLSAHVEDSLTQLNILSGQMKSMDERLMGPLQGKADAKFTAQGQAAQANLNSIVLGAPALLGLPGSALRIGSLWKIIQASKPDMTQWMPAAEAITANLQYMGALKIESIWKQQAEQMKALQKSNPEEANQWFKDHPDPIKTYPKPDLTKMYEMFPETKNLGLEKDWDTVKAQADKEEADRQAASLNKGQPQQITSPITPANPTMEQLPETSSPKSEVQPIGTMRVLNGITYTKQADGWHAQ